MIDESASSYAAKAKQCQRLALQLPAKDPLHAALLHLAVEFGAKAAEPLDNRLPQSGGSAMAPELHSR